VRKVLIEVIPPTIFMLCGLSLTGVIFDRSSLSSIFPGTTTTRLITAMCFLVSGLQMFLMKKDLSVVDDRKYRMIAVSICSQWLLFLLLGVLGLQLMKDRATAQFPEWYFPLAREVTSYPRLVTIVNFFLIALSGISYIFNTSKKIARARCLSTSIAVVSISTILLSLLASPIRPIDVFSPLVFLLSAFYLHKIPSNWRAEEYEWQIVSKTPAS